MAAISKRNPANGATNGKAQGDQWEQAPGLPLLAARRRTSKRHDVAPAPPWALVQHPAKVEFIPHAVIIHRFGCAVIRIGHLALGVFVNNRPKIRPVTYDHGRKIAPVKLRRLSHASIMDGPALSQEMADFCGIWGRPLTYAKGKMALSCEKRGSRPLQVLHPLGRTRDFQAPPSARARPTIPVTRLGGAAAAGCRSAGVATPLR